VRKLARTPLICGYAATAASAMAAGASSSHGLATNRDHHSRRRGAAPTVAV